jgi:hypothetical protein
VSNGRGGEAEETPFAITVRDGEVVKIAEGYRP